MTQPPPGGSSPQPPRAPDGEQPAEETENLPARRGEERLAEPVVRTGMFGAHGTERLGQFVEVAAVRALALERRRAVHP